MIYNKNFFCKENDSIKSVLNKISNNKNKLCIVLNKNKKFIGIITDGDIRRAILKHDKIDIICKHAINFHPVVTKKKSLDLELIKKLNKLNTNFAISLNNNHSFNKIIYTDLSSNKIENRNTIVIMSGGKGKRLYPLTKNKPKALIKITKKTIIEIIINKFLDEGFSNFIICLGHKSKMIIDFLKLKYPNLAIKYVIENKPLGTAGALSKINKNNKLPFFVINCDILSNINFKNLLDYHNKNKSSATMCIYEKKIQNDFGVVRAKANKFIDIDEKPIVKFYINAGIYILNNKIIKLIPKNKYFNMTELFKLIKKKKLNNSVYPILENWIDIGNLLDLKNSRKNLKLYDL